MKQQLTTILSLFNENKLLILKDLYECPDYLCGCDLIGKIDIPKNLLSYHIKSLENIGLIKETRCGKRKQYRIVPRREEKVRKILEITELIKEKKIN